MADFTPLLTNFKDDVLASSNSKRKYRMINNSDGTVSFEDATAYSQKGSEFGAKEVNEEREAINKLNTDMNAVADYVVERGWAGSYSSWFYTKWNSGYIEVESTRDLDGSSGWTAYGKTNGGNTTVNIGIWGKPFAFNLPDGLFFGAPTSCQLTCDWDCYGVSDNMPNWTATSFGIIVFSGGGYGVDELLRINIKLGGRWK